MKWKLLAVCCVSLILIVGLISFVWSSTPSGGPYYLHVPTSTWSYEIGVFSNGSYYAVNGANWKVDYQSINASEVIQSAEDAIETAGGGQLFFKKATYTITTKLMINEDHIHWDAESGTVFTGTILPIFEIDGSNGGAAGGGHPTSGLDTVYSLQDIYVSNIIFYYTGVVATGSFVLVHGIQNDYTYRGGAELSNLVIYSSQVAQPTDTTFVGLNFHDNVGVTLKDINISYFGIGFQDFDVYEGDMINIENMNISYCYRGIWISDSAGGGVNRVTWTNLKVMYCNGDYSIYLSQMPNNSVFINLRCEGNNPSLSNLLAKGRKLVILGGYFYAFGVRAIIWNTDQGVSHLFKGLIENVVFSTGTTAILVGQDITLIGNTYSSVTTPISINAADASHVILKALNDGFVTQSSGSEANCVNGTAIAHGLSGTANVTNTMINLQLAGTNPYVNATAYYFIPTVLSVNATHFVISFCMNIAGTYTPVGLYDAKTITWDCTYKP